MNHAKPPTAAPATSDVTMPLITLGHQKLFDITWNSAGVFRFGHSSSGILTPKKGQTCSQPSPSSSLMLNSPALWRRSARIREDTYSSGCWYSGGSTNKTSTYDFTLRDQLSSIKLSDDAFEDFIPNRGQHPLIIVHAETLVDFW